MKSMLSYMYYRIISRESVMPAYKTYYVKRGVDVNTSLFSRPFFKYYLHAFFKYFFLVEKVADFDYNIG